MCKMPGKTEGMGALAESTDVCCCQSQVSVVPKEEYVVPEGQRVKEGSRKMRRKELYVPRAVERAQMMDAAEQVLEAATAVA